MAALLKFHDAVTRLSYQGATLIVLLIAGSYCYEVASRYFFDSPTEWANVFVSYALCALIFLAMPEQTRRHAHIAITVLADRANPAQKRQLQIGVAIVSALACLVVFYICADETWIQFRDGLLTVATYEIPKWWISIFMAYGLLSTTLYFVREAFDPSSIPETEGAMQ
jgi:TRAP-type C4-dicarboxylate transport system permease small subunit